MAKVKRRAMPRQIIESAIKFSVGDGVYLCEEEMSQMLVRKHECLGWIDGGMQRIRFVPKGTFGIIEGRYHTSPDYLVVFVQLPEDQHGPATERHILVHKRRVRLTQD